MNKITIKDMLEEVLRDRETPESLEMAFSGMDGTIVTFDNRILVAGYYWNGPGRPAYFGAIYTALDDEDLDAETDLELTAISPEFYYDDGHAIKWALETVTKK